MKQTKEKNRIIDFLLTSNLGQKEYWFDQISEMTVSLLKEAKEKGKEEIREQIRKVCKKDGWHTEDIWKIVTK